MAVFSGARCVVFVMVIVFVNSTTARMRAAKLEKQYLPTSNVQVHYNLTSAAVTSQPAAVTSVETPTVITTEETSTETSTPAANACDCVCGVGSRKQRIVGGGVARLNEFPWIAALSRLGKFYCGGALITRRHVLTAAHCIDNINVKEIRVVLGEHDRLKKNESVTIERRVIKGTAHSDFKITTFNNDLAVLELDAPVELGPSIRTACLPRVAGKDYTGLNTIIAGWGRVEERKPVSSVLLKVAVPVMSMEACRKAGYNGKRITDNMICAGYPDGKKDACQGDSGGPMHLDVSGGMEVIGLVSWGRGCARPNFPGIYTRLGNYIDWIHEKLGDECVCPPAH